MSPDRPESLPVVSPPAETSVPAFVYPYRAGMIGGALGGLAMIGVAIAYGLSGAHSLWLPVNLLGATLLRDLQTASLEELSSFNAGALLVGLALHLALAAGLGFVFALILPTLPGPPLIWALMIGPALWAVASLLTLPLLNPVMTLYLDRPSFFIAHIVYSLVLGAWIMHTPKVPA